MKTMEYKEHNKENLQNAIKDLPEFEAPNIWHSIERNLPYKRKRYFWLILIIPIAASLVLFIPHEQNSNLELTHSQLSSENCKEIIINPEETESLFAELNSAEYFENSNKTIFNPISVPNSDKIDPIIETEYLPQIDLPKFIADTQIVYHEIGDNLVPNHSFEEFRTCPKDFNKKSSKNFIPDWKMASKGTPDYFNKCSKGNVSVPNNFAGTAHPKTGEGYIGLISRQNFTKDNRVTGEKPMEYREYIQARLNIPLEKGEDYKICFYIQMANKSRFATDGMGALLSKEAVYLKDKGVMNYFPQIENLRGNILDNQDYWVKIEAVITAEGGEEYITIGNFRHNNETFYRMINNTEFNYAYYFIEDVSVIKVRTEKLIVYLPINNSLNSYNENHLILSENPE
jgi:hypothetical protein